MANKKKISNRNEKLPTEPHFAISLHRSSVSSCCRESRVVKEFPAPHKLAKQTRLPISNMQSGTQWVCSSNLRLQQIFLIQWNLRKKQPSSAEIFWYEKPRDAASLQSHCSREFLEFWPVVRLNITTAQHNGWVFDSREYKTACLYWCMHYS